MVAHALWKSEALRVVPWLGGWGGGGGGGGGGLPTFTWRILFITSECWQHFCGITLYGCGGRLWYYVWIMARQTVSFFLLSMTGKECCEILLLRMISPQQLTLYFLHVKIINTHIVIKKYMYLTSSLGFQAASIWGYDIPFQPPCMYSSSGFDINTSQVRYLMRGINGEKLGLKCLNVWKILTI